MNAEVKAKWVEALRSGRFTQGTGKLALVEDGITKHCCLGVLCEVLGVPKTSYETKARSEGGKMTDKDITAFSYGAELYSQDLYLPADAMQAAGLTARNPMIPTIFRDGTRGHVALSDYNDGAAAVNNKRHTFNEIADLIEEHL